jgi:hypothetical protein
MPLVIGRGPSVNGYKFKDIKKAARLNFTFAVNGACFDFPCDMVVASDYQWILDNQAKLKKLDKPIVTRDWDVLKQLDLDLDLDLIMLPSKVVEYARLSGQIAVKISDSFSAQLHNASFVLGIDHTARHYDCVETTQQPIPDIINLDSYARLNCKSTINIGAASAINCWPRHHMLPDIDRPNEMDKKSGELFIRTNAEKLFYWGIKK